MTSWVRGRSGVSPARARPIEAASVPPMKIGMVRCGASVSWSTTRGAPVLASRAIPVISTSLMSTEVSGLSTTGGWS